MKQDIRRVGLSFRGWILVAGLGLTVPAVALVGGSKGLAKTGPALGLAPAVAQQSSASQINASPLMKRIQSIAQPQRLRIIKERLAPLAPALAPSAPALMPFAPVTITKDASPISGSSVAQGQVIAYNIQATNGASSDTTTGIGGFVHIIDTAPAGTLFTNATVQQQPQFGSAWSCTLVGGGASIECHAGDGAGANVDTFTTQEFVKIRAEVTVQPSTVNGTILTNTATFQFDNDGAGLEENVTSNAVFHVVNPTADLGITKVTSNPTPTAGGAAFSYTVTVTNNGPNPARDVIVTDPLPPGIIFQNIAVFMNPASPAMNCTGPPVATNGVVVCNSANFPAGQVATITIVGQVVPNVASGVRTNTATVTSGTPEPVPNVFPNTASVQQNIVVDAPLSITKAGPAVACPGDQFTYHISVFNAGSSTALNATISDPLPANTTFQSISGTGAFANTCSFNGAAPGTVSCPAVNIPTGQSTLDITVKLAAGAPNGNLGNTATITSAGTGTIAVGTSTSTATIGCSTNLSINNTSVTEGTGGTTPATFTVSMPSSTQTVTVDYVTSDITASAPSDYTSQAGTLTFAPGVTTRSIIVPVIGDSAAEPTETFLVTLFNPTNAAITTAQGTGTINDDDATGVFQFSAATASIAENANPGSVNLTINRTGDTTGVASVNFETSDITALQKSDYTFNSGTVQFAPGDTSKVVKVLIVNDAFVDPAETFRVSLSNPSGNFVVGPTNSVVVTITDDDGAPGPNPIDTAGFFVRQQYLDFLGREPDAAGLAFWTNNITSCGADASCTAARRIDTSAAFFLSNEFQETSGNVIRTQRVAFSRLSAEAASRVPYLQFMRDTRQVGQGVVDGAPGAAALLEQNKQAYALAIVNSPAFIARFPVSPAAVYVDSLTVSAAVVLTVAERNAAITAFGLGGTAGRVAALRSIVDSTSLRAAEVSPSFVLAEYYGYLRRNPTDAPDFNDAGYQFWLTKLNTFNGDFRQADMVKSFILSTEYRQRFGTP